LRSKKIKSDFINSLLVLTQDCYEHFYLDDLPENVETIPENIETIPENIEEIPEGKFISIVC